MFRDTPRSHTNTYILLPFFIYLICCTDYLGGKMQDFFGVGWLGRLFLPRFSPLLISTIHKLRHRYHQTSATKPQRPMYHSTSFEFPCSALWDCKGLFSPLSASCRWESAGLSQYMSHKNGNVLAPTLLQPSLTPSRQWKRIRSHVSPKDELPEFLATSAAKSRRSVGSSPSAPQRGRASADNIPQAPDTTSRGPSPFSAYHLETSGREQGPLDELGLHVVHQPSSPAPLDIIFVHGLGGASHRTWSKNQDHSRFWPQQWLPLEPDIGSARIFTFGYNARFRSGGPQNMNIADFAKDLLFEMKFGKGTDKEDLEIGKVRP